MPDDRSPNWGQAQIHVMNTLERLETQLNKMSDRTDQRHLENLSQMRSIEEKLDTRLDAMSTDLTSVKVKVGFIGMLSGAAPGLVGLLWQFWKNR